MLESVWQSLAHMAPGPSKELRPRPWSSSQIPVTLVVGNQPVFLGLKGFLSYLLYRTKRSVMAQLLER